MEVGSYIVLDNDTKLRNLRSGEGTMSYTMDGQVLLMPGMIVPVIRAGSNCLGIAKVEVVTIREENTTVYFRMIDTDGNYDSVYDVWASMTNNYSSRGGNFGIPKSGRTKFQNSHRGNGRRHDEDDYENGGGGLSADDIRKLYGGG